MRTLPTLRDRGGGVMQSTVDWRSGIPILMYHAFAFADEAATHYLVPRRRLAQHLAWLKGRGYQGLTLVELAQALRHGQPLPQRAVVITIDDGYRDNLTVAAPLLEHYGYPVTLFMVSDRVGLCNDWDRAGVLAGRPLLDWASLRSLASAGWTIGHHGRSHRRLIGCDQATASIEIIHGRAELEAGLGRAVETFAYPHGDYDAVSQHVVAEADFTAVATTQSGLNRSTTSRLALRRADVGGEYGLVRFILTVVTGWTLRRPARAALWRRLRR